MTLEQTYTYYAFVSYSHKDETWGRWIQRALESYRLPAAVRKEVGKPLPQRIHPVFRDDTDLGAGRLADNLRQELEQSRYLIVVCSPNSAKPNDEGKHWVNEEVTRFCEMGRADRVIPVIVEGTADTSFCPKIVEEGLLGLDATRHSRARILNDLVAKILGLRPDELWRREERRLRAKRRWRIFGASLAASLVALGGYIWWDCTRTVTRAFADYVDSYGLPEGILPLTKEQVSHRHVHYRFEFRGYRFGKSIHADSAGLSLLRALGFRRVLKRVVHSDSYGNATGYNDFLFEHRPVIADISFDDVGMLKGICAKDGNNSPRGYSKWSFAKAAGSANDTEATVTFLAPDGKTVCPAPILFGEIGQSNDDIEVDDSEKTSLLIMEWRVRFSNQGRTVKILFQNAFHRPVPDEHGIIAIEMQRSDGQTRWMFEPEPDSVIRTTYVRTGKTFIHNGRKRRFKGIYVNRIYDDPAKNSWDVDQFGYSSILRENIDEETVRTSFLDGDGNLKWHPLRWWAFRDQVFLDGNIVSVRFDSKEDARGGIWSPRLEDADDAVYAHYYRLAVGHRSAFDSCGTETNRVYIDRFGLPITTECGLAGFQSKVDQAGWTTSRIFLGEDLQPVALEDGGHTGWARTYDASHRTVAFWYLGLDGRPFHNHREFYSGWERDYDDSGNVIEMRFLGVDGRPRLLPSGFASWTAGFDNAGNETNTVWRGENGLPLLRPEGFAARARAFDVYGNVTNVVYLGEDLLPILLPEGYAGSATRYDRSARATKRSFFDTAMKPVLREGGYAGWNKAFDETGNETNRMYWGAKGELVAVADNGFGEKIGPVAGWWKRFGPKGDMIAAGTVGTNGLPIENALGWATWRLENGEEAWFDSAGRPIRQTGIGSKTSWDTPSIRTTWHFDRGTAKPVADKNGAFGEREWLNEFGEVTNRLFLAADETPVVMADGHSGIAYEYGVFGENRKTTKTTWYGPDGKPVMSKDWNCAVLVDAYDDWGWNIAHIKYDENGNLIEQYPDEGAAYRLFEMPHSPQTYTETTMRWIETETKMTWIGTNGIPVVGKKSGYAWRTHDYCENQFTVTNRYFDAEGRSVFLEGGHCGTIIAKDHHRNETNVVYIGRSDLPVVHSKYGYASRSRTYDYSWGDDKDKKKMTSELYFDAGGNPIAKKTGEAGWRDKFDDYGRQIERTYFGTNGLPVMTKYGFATRQMFYDETTGVETNRVMLDADGEVIQPKKKGEKKKYSWKPHYDEAGLLVEETYEAEDGTLDKDYPTRASSITYKYDNNGMETNRMYRGIHGEPILCDRWPMNKDSTPGRQWRGERGYFELRQVYDDQGRLAEKSFWNTNGTAIACSVGAHIMRYAYDAAGHLIETRFFGTDSQPCANREGVHVEQRILGKDGTWADTVRLAVDGTRLCKWTTEVVKSVTPGSFADQLGIRPGDRWVKWGDNIFSEADLSSMKPNMGRVDFERWQERMRQSSIDPNFVSILAKKDHDDFVILAFFSRILNSTTLGFENAWNRTSPTEQEGAALLSRTVGWLQTSSPKSIVLYDGAEKR